MSNPDDLPRDLRGRPPSLSPDEDRADELLAAAMGRVNDLLGAVVERDPTGRWFAMVIDARLRPMDDLRLVEDLLRHLLAAVQRVGDLLDLVTALHFGRFQDEVPWGELEAVPAPWTRPVEEWPALIDWNDR